MKNTTNVENLGITAFNWMTGKKLKVEEISAGEMDNTQIFENSMEMDIVKGHNCYLEEKDGKIIAFREKEGKIIEANSKLMIETKAKVKPENIITMTEAKAKVQRKRFEESSKEEKQLA